MKVNIKKLVIYNSQSELFAVSSGIIFGGRPRGSVLNTRKQTVLRRLLRAKKIETSRKDFHSRIGIIAYYCLHSVVVANIIGGDAFRCCRLSLHILLGYCAASRHHRASISSPHAVRNVAIIVQNLAPSEYITYPPLFLLMNERIC